MNKANGPATDGTQRLAKQPGRFNVAFSIVLFTVVVLGFLPSFFARPVFEERALHWVLIVHGVVATSWFVLLVSQSLLVRLRRIRFHRRMGVLGFVLVIAIFVTGMPVAFGLGARLVEAGEAESSSLGTASHWAQVARDGLLFFLFAMLAIVGIVFRKRVEIHKRFISLASVVLTTPALARVSQFAFLRWVPEPLGFLGLFGILLALPAIRDRLVEGRVHSILKWGIPTCFALVFLLLLLPEVV